MSSQPLPASLVPVHPAERIQVLDILRGFALFGILLVNMQIFSHPIQVILFPTDPATPWPDRVAEWLILTFGEGKFYALFSMLFGMGMMLLMGRVEARGGRFVPLYVRRLLVLLGIGLVHAFLIWMGDILVMYALLGFLLLLFRKAQPRTLLIWIGVFIAVPIMLLAGATALVALGRSIPEGAAQMDAAFAQIRSTFLADLERAYRVYSEGNFAEITAQRVYDYLSMGLSSFYFIGFNVMAMFLLGVYLDRRGVFRDLESHRGLFRKLLVWGLALGLAGNALYATLIMPRSRFEMSGPLLLATVAHTLGAPLLMLAYVSAISLLMLRPPWEQRLRVLAPAGQMALTNYLAQSIICTLIFYGYGLGLFGKVGAAAGIGLTLLIYFVQVLFSRWWMRRFLFGPAEWLWRSLTYLKWQPFRRSG
ncbi:MAG: DUF418 domain-containing protein [Anaerolineae bacterium]|nr:DUF418 domain-containing protein [Anaerolineae bacterium]